MLIYFIPETSENLARWLEEGHRNAERMIATWEKLMRPVAIVGTAWRWSLSTSDRCLNRPRPGDLFFASNSGSLLRDRNFQCLDSDLGHPALVFVGGSIEKTILPTIVDCAMSSRPAFVAADAIFSRTPEFWGDKERSVRNDLISNYANVLTTKEIINER
jgi:hypothetical protein